MFILVYKTFMTAANTCPSNWPNVSSETLTSTTITTSMANLYTHCCQSCSCGWLFHGYVVWGWVNVSLGSRRLMWAQVHWGEYMGRAEESEQLRRVEQRELREQERGDRTSLCVCACVCVTWLLDWRWKKEGKTGKNFLLFLLISNLTTSYFGKLSFTLRDGGPNWSE